MKIDPGLAARLIEQEKRFGAHDPRPMDVVCSRGDGVYVWDVQGNRYMDFLTAHGAVNQGHSHTRIAAAMVEQCLRLALTSRNLRNDRLPPFLEKLCTLTGFEAAMIMSCATEAMEAAHRAALGWAHRIKGIEPERTQVMVFSGGAYDRFASAPGYLSVPFGDLAAARAKAGRPTCAILVEPVQGVGTRIPPRGFLKGLRELCDGEGLLLLIDEIHSGFGRTGKLFAFEHEGLRPDGLLLGNSLAGGFYPVSAFLTSREIMDLATPGAAASAFGGNPLACAVASAAVDVIMDERLADRSAELGAYFLARLRAIESTLIKEVRGQGLWAGIELRECSPRPFCEALAHEGLLCEGSADKVINLSPPLIITREQLDWALEKLERVLGA